MQINTENQLVSMTDANQNFSKVARLVDQSGAAIILKNNRPKYVIMDYKSFSNYQTMEEERLETISKRILQDRIHVFEELAK